MNYDEARSYIHRANKFGIKLGLENIENLMVLLGNIHRKLKVIHIAGTNGKGSVATYISNVLIASDYKVGIFTSPYIEEFEERIRINEKNIAKDDLVRITKLIKEKVNLLISKGFNHPTEFEIVTAIGMQYFYDNFCDVVVMEVGLGGRYDATNIIENPILSVITSISYDHMEYLGCTLEEIAYEKAGIIKKNTPVISYPQEDAVISVLKRVCAEKNTELKIMKFDEIKNSKFNFYQQIFDYKEYKNLGINMRGSYQIKNACLALKTIELLIKKNFKITKESIYLGLKKAKWPGRFELVKTSPFVLVDGGHNKQGIEELVKEIYKYFAKSKKIFMVSILKTKDYVSMIEILAQVADSIIIFNSQIKDAAEPAKLFEIAKKYCINKFFNDKIEEAYNLAIELANEEDLICVCGSLYLIGELKRILNK